MWEITTHVGRHPEPNVDYNHYVNKYLVKDVVRPIINVAKPFYYIRNMSEFADINFDDLPSKFIAKAAHGWNMQYISTGNKVADKERLETLCPLWLKRKFGHKKERHYRQVERGVVFEEYLGENLLEYKFLVIDHQIEEIEIEQCSSVKSFAPVDTDWKHRDGVCKQSGAWQFQPNLATEKPANLQELLKTVERLSRRIGDVLFVRIDIYDVDGVLYFGEYTFTPNAGKIDPCDYPSYDKYIGSLIDFKPAINDDIPEPAVGFLLDIIDGEILLHHPARPQAICLSHTAALVWQLCDSYSTVSDIIDMVQEGYPDAQDVGADVRKTIKHFVEDGALHLRP